ncbi:MAG: trypsin-like peptidase domain-containing protein [Pirellulaceae bacterium]
MEQPVPVGRGWSPTITLGIVSGIQRYQYGSGQNQLVYGNCIQVDSSINPGNSGGPLFNMRAEVIGINGRGSFADRGRVNVGLGYAISSDQVKNFLPDLLATKLTEHGSLDAQFGLRQGAVVCERINLDSAAARAGLALGDRLVRFQGLPITSANQFTNLISTMPEGWPVTLDVVDDRGEEKTIRMRLLGLPYQTPPEPEIPEDAPPEQKQAIERQLRLIRLLRSPPGQMTNREINLEFGQRVLTQVRERLISESGLESDWTGTWQADGNRALTIQLTASGWKLEQQNDQQSLTAEGIDGEYRLTENGGDAQSLSKVAARGRAELFLADVLHQLVHGLAEGSVVELDGADLAAGSVCQRLKVVEADDEWFYLWVRSLDDAFGRQGDLIKISMDVDGDPAAWRFSPGSDALDTVELTSGLGEESLAIWQRDPTAEPRIAVTSLDEQVSPIDAVRVNPLFEAAIATAWERTVKVYGASAGNVEGYGTGILVSADGLILTGTGVHLTGRTIRVQIPGRGLVNATLVRQDRPRQLALLKADLQDVPFFDLSQPSTAARGDWAVLVTNAFKVADGDEPLSVSLGVISLPTQLLAMRNRRDVAYDGDLVLVDAITSNPGAAGGAVIDADGRLIGMSGRVIESGDTNTRLNYAVPTETLRQFVAGELSDSVASDGGATDMDRVPGEVGIRLLRLGLSGSRDPAYIDRVMPRSPAAEAGLRSDDLIVSLDGEKVNSIADYNERSKSIFAGVETVIVVKRGDELLRFILMPVEK